MQQWTSKWFRIDFKLLSRPLLGWIKNILRGLFSCSEEWLQHIMMNCCTMTSVSWFFLWKCHAHCWELSMFNATSSSSNDPFLILCKCPSFNKSLPSADLWPLLVFQSRLTFMCLYYTVIKCWCSEGFSALVCWMFVFYIYRDDMRDSGATGPTHTTSSNEKVLWSCLIRPTVQTNVGFVHCLAFPDSDLF